MPQTRSNQTGIVIQMTSSDEDELSDPPDTLSSPPPVSFNGRLAKYSYADRATKENSSLALTRASPRASTKRSHDATVIKTGPSNFAPSALSPRPSKKQRKSSKYADPSKYSHLSPLVDILEHNLVCVFVGTNPGISTARQGHAYAHPSNHFWKLLHSSGLTSRRLAPSEDRNLPARFCMGNTNIVSRPSKDAAELSKEEMTEGTRELERKFAEYKPEAVCIVGKGIWEAIWRFKHGRNIRKEEFQYGWQDVEHNMGKTEGWEGSRVFVATSTSGLAASLKPAEKEAIWKPFGDWVQKRREERGFVPREVGQEMCGSAIKVEAMVNEEAEA